METSIDSKDEMVYSQDTEPLSQEEYDAALALGQDAELLRQIMAREVHPILAAYGLWHEAVDLATLTDDIYANRRRQISRAGATMDD